MRKDESQRIYFWDNAKGILIFLVVLGHFLLPYRSTNEIKIVVDVIYFFHMPAFVFISGYLSRFVSDLRKANSKLIVAYLLFNLPMMVYGVNFEGLEPSFLTPYYSYWYLLALFAWRLMTPIFSKSWEMLIFSVAASILAGFWGEIDNTLALSRIIGFLPFFLAGSMISDHHLKDFFSKQKPINTFAAGCLLALTLLAAGYLSATGVAMSDLLFFPYETPLRFIYRVGIFLITISVLVCSAILLTQKPIWMLQKWGKNSLTIYVLHRYIPLLIFAHFPFRFSPAIILAVSFLASLVTIFVLGSDRINLIINRLLDTLAVAVGYSNKDKKLARVAFILILLCYPLFAVSFKSLPKNDVIHPVLNAEQIDKIENAVSISFVGDMILLRDQVIRAYRPLKENYDFDPLFEFSKQYFHDSDFSIGVLEGPFGGSEKGYSTSNYSDGIPLYLNFPDAFANSIKKAGVDLVTIANNHLLDMGIDGAMRTMDVLNEKNIQFVGAYRNQSEKDRVFIVEEKGIKIAVLAYTYPINYYSESYFFEESTSITSVIVEHHSPFFNDAVSHVRRDFYRAKAENPDLIVVLPHMGTQFTHQIDKTQEVWNEIFIREGADIILGSHSHAVQPIEFRTIKRNGLVRQAVIVNSPGNFVNSYLEHDGDATSIVKIFINSESKSVLCAGVIPMFTQAPYQGQYRALPVYDMLFNPTVKDQISSFEMKRAEEIQTIVSQTMIGIKLTLDQAQEIYYLFPDGYYRQPVEGIDLSKLSYNSDLYRMLHKSRSLLFVGDSVTHGTKNGGYGWYEPLVQNIPEISVAREAWPSATTYTLLDNLDDIISHAADLYVIAIGTNDIRYRKANICAMTAQEYVENVDKIVKAIIQKRPDADFILVSPWPSLPNDPYSKVTDEQKSKLFLDYSKSLKAYSKQNGYLFVDPGSRILSAITRKIGGYYILDHIHPNAAEGIRLYSEAFLAPTD